MKKNFATLKQRMVTDTIPFTKEQFIELITSVKPKEIYNGEWSHKKPFIEITEYNEEGVKLFCNGHADTTPQQKSIGEVYNFLKFQGLAESYIHLH